MVYMCSIKLYLYAVAFVYEGKWKRLLFALDTPEHRPTARPRAAPEGRLSV